MSYPGVFSDAGFTATGISIGSHGGRRGSQTLNQSRDVEDEVEAYMAAQEEKVMTLN
jgi:hypothetical protein